MSFAINLNEIRSDFPEESVKHLRREGSSCIGDVFAGVQVEVDAEEAVGPAEFLRGLGKGGITGQQDGDDQAMAQSWHMFHLSGSILVDLSISEMI
jgi:hypothetical protein